jgi:Fungal specific transcription factor domain
MHLQEHLAEVFFECIYGQSYLLLHKPSFMRKLKAGAIPPVLTLAVCAIAARFSTHPAVGGEPAFLRGEIWAAPARAIVEKRHYEPNITILTVMLILGLHTYGTCQGGLSWSFSGQAMRMAYALQLHKELDHDPLGRRKDKASELSSTDREIRRRTMWACFLMDRFSASGTERPSFGNEDYLHIQLPIKESHFQMEIPGPTENLSGDVPNPITPGHGQVSDARDNMGIAAYVIRAVVLWGRIVKYLNLGGKEKDPHPIWDPKSGFADLRRQLDTFQESIPGFLVYNAENLANQAAEHVANQFIYLHIIMAQNLLFLNRFAIPVSPGARPPKDMPKQFLSDAGREVVEAANRISTLIENAAGHMLTVPFAGYCAYAASTVQVWGIFSKNPQLEASSKENLRHNYKYLNKMKKYWGMFHYLAESVKDIYRHFADASIKGIVTADNSNVGTPMFQYGDWFDKYPVGVSRTEFEDLDRGVKEEPGADAPMSQQSDLQSVEEFFASLSPPSKADLPRKVPRRHGKSVSDARKPSDPRVDLHGSSQLAQRQQSLASLVEMSGSNPPYNTQQMIYPQDPFEAQANFDLSASNFYPTNPLPQLDRQMVFGAAYAGMDPSQNANASFGLGDSFNMWDGIEMNAFGINGNSWLSQSSTAWMMPFNMEPPQIVDIDNSLSTGDFSMGNTFSGPSGPVQNRGLHDLGLDGDQLRSV